MFIRREISAFLSERMMAGKVIVVYGTSRSRLACSARRFGEHTRRRRFNASPRAITSHACCPAAVWFRPHSNLRGSFRGSLNEPHPAKQGGG